MAEPRIKRKITAHKGGRTKHISLYHTPLEKERIDRLRGDNSISDLVHIAVYAFDALSEKERQEWIKIIREKA